MDRDKVITLLYKYYGNGMSLDESNEVIASYCREKGKEDEYIGQFILCLMIITTIRNHCLYHALRYYRQKYNIIEIYKVSPNDLAGHKQIILIY